MKKAACVLLAALFVLGVMLTPSASAVEIGGQTVIFTIVNSTLAPLRSDTMPFFSSGLLYVPYTVFTDYFGIVSISNTRDNLFLLSDENNTLFFNTSGGGCYDRAGKTYNYSIVYRGGLLFVPVTFVSSAFGLVSTYSAPSSVVRIRNGSSSYTDAFVIAALSANMAIALKALEASAPVQTPDEPEEPQFVPFDLYLLFTDIGGEGTEDVLGTLSRFGLHAAFFATEREILENEALIRRIYVEGHTIGLIAPCSAEDSVQTMLDALAAGNAALDRVLNLKTRLVLIEQGSNASTFTEEMRQALQTHGYRYWDRMLPGEGIEENADADRWLEGLTAQFMEVTSTTVLGLSCTARSPALIEGVRAFVRENDCSFLSIDDIISPVNYHGDMW